MVDGNHTGYPMTPETTARPLEVPAADAETQAGVWAQLEEAVRRYQSPMLHYAEQMLPHRRDRAQDVVQDAFLRLRKALLNGQEILRQDAWLYRVTRNLAIDINRREGRSCQLEEGMLQDAAIMVETRTGDPGPAATFARNEAHQLAMHELQQLPEDDRQILLLKLFEGLTLREISEMTGTNIGTIHYRLNRGLRALSQRFKELGAI